MTKHRSETLPGVIAIKHSALHTVKNISLDALREELLAGGGHHSEFTLLTAPLAPSEQTSFKWVTDGSAALLVVACYHTMSNSPSGFLLPDENIEIYFDRRRDEIGWEQNSVHADGSPAQMAHLPYPEMHASSCKQIRPLKWETCTEQFEQFLGCRWFFVWFDTDEIFKWGDTVGFNLVRLRSLEYSAWNFPGGNGALDATGLGVLHRHENQLPATPDFFPASAPVSEDFKLSVTYDSPDCVTISHYTPERLARSMAFFKSYGVSRLHWIDYSDWPSFWELDFWRDPAAKTFQECGDLLTCAVEQAHAQDLEFIADFKIFDLGCNYFISHEHGANPIAEIENRVVSAIPAIEQNQQWTMRANQDWMQPAGGSATVLRFWSDEPLRPIQPEQVHVFVSDDNRSYLPYPGAFKVTSGQAMRPHQRWTPAGNEPSEGSELNWYLEISSLDIAAKYVSLCIDGENVQFHHRGHMVADVLDISGKPLPHTVATDYPGESNARYTFWKEWPGWANITEPQLSRRAWNGNNFGLALWQMPSMPTILEPAYEGTRGIWLNHVRRLLESGVDGISLRIFCHHNGVMNYLQYAYAPAVLELFQVRYGRKPQTTPEDYELIRILRGEAITQFVRQAKALCEAYGKKLMLHLESGVEVPPHLNTRMQLWLDWKGWVAEGLIDEIHLKFWTPYSRFVHQQVMPLAKEKGIPVHVISRNLSGLIDERFAEVIPQLVEDAHGYGFNGYCLYEVADMLKMNPQGTFMPRGVTQAALEKVRNVLDSLQ